MGEEKEDLKKKLEDSLLKMMQQDTIEEPEKITEKSDSQDNLREELNEQLIQNLEGIGSDSFKKEKHQNTRERASKKKHNMGRGSRIVLTAFLGVLLFLVVLSVCVMGIYVNGKNHMTSCVSMEFRTPEGVTASFENNGRTVTYENREYKYRTGTANLLVIGKNPDHTFATVVVNFDGKSKELRYLPVPAELLAIDYTSAMNYSDIADSVSKFLCGLPVQGYMVLDMQIVDKLLNVGTGEIQDTLQMQKLITFLSETVDNTSENWMIPAKLLSKFQESFRTNLKVADLLYLYTLLFECQDISQKEYTEPKDHSMLFQQILETFYDEKMKT